jgi:hypothetical protein
LQGVVNAQHADTAVDPRIAREQRPPKSAMAVEMKQPTQRQNRRLSRGDPVEPVIEANSGGARQPALGHVEPDMVPAIREDRVIQTRSVGHNR